MGARSRRIPEDTKDLGKLELVCINCRAVITADDIDRCPHCGEEPYVKVVTGLRI